MLNSVLSLYYYLRIVMFMYQRSEVTASEPVVPPLAAATLAVAAVGTVVIGVYPAWLIDAADASARLSWTYDPRWWNLVDAGA